MFLYEYIYTIRIKKGLPANVLLLVILSHYINHYLIVTTQPSGAVNSPC